MVAELVTAGRRSIAQQRGDKKLLNTAKGAYHWPSLPVSALMVGLSATHRQSAAVTNPGSELVVATGISAHVDTVDINIQDGSYRFLVHFWPLLQRLH